MFQFAVADFKEVLLQPKEPQEKYVFCTFRNVNMIFIIFTLAIYFLGAFVLGMTTSIFIGTWNGQMILLLLAITGGYIVVGFIVLVVIWSIFVGVTLCIRLFCK